MLVMPEEMDFSRKHFSAIIYGAPGVGKTTLALSAPKPLLIDFDGGVSRVKAYHRCLTLVCQNYDEVLRDIKDDAVKDCETIVVDTGGSFIAYLQEWAMRQNPAANRQKNGAISLKGFGAVKQEFQHFSSLIRDTMQKNVIFVFHSEETKDKDGNPMQRLLCEGAAKNIVWQPCDFGGYLQMIGSDRVLSLSPTQEFFAKGCYGMSGNIPVPSIGETDKNDFLTRLFDKARDNIKSEADIYAPIRERYENAMTAAKGIVSAVESAEDATSAISALLGLDHALTSKKEASAMLNDRAKELGLIYDPEKKAYAAKGV